MRLSYSFRRIPWHRRATLASELSLQGWMVMDSARLSIVPSRCWLTLDHHQKLAHFYD